MLLFLATAFLRAEVGSQSSEHGVVEPFGLRANRNHRLVLPRLATAASQRKAPYKCRFVHDHQLEALLSSRRDSRLDGPMS